MNFYSDLFNLALLLIASISAVVLFRMGGIRGRGGLDHASATQLINKRHALVVDVRSPAEYAIGHIPNSRNIPVDALAEKTQNIAKDKPIILVCKNGAQSFKAIERVKQGGFADVFHLDGGTSGWEQAGFPLITASEKSTAR